MPKNKVREEHQQAKHEAFSDWVDAMRLRAVVKGLHLDRITEEEWKAYERPTAGAFQ